MVESAAPLVYIHVRSGSYEHRCPAMRPVERDGGGRPARWSASFGYDRGVVSWPAPVNLADNGAWPGPSLVRDCRAAAATLDGQLRRRRSRHHMKTSYGLSGMVLEWFRSYLVGRHQYVRIRSSSASTLMLILCGVPQRSVLGPILFCTPPTLYC